ncbi:alpha/beta hydrolase [Formosa sp. PL04]|uniref:alpha/beta hydrolase n=1 Tax=Formosa sp. PL04 TaxID=3081755 RepID=UPI00298174E9|nr:alpha/beta hydrolase [Formosa sp. PL04]MDW5289551.1 alpha/beta hydrolase [Formosa sp. PL04]
MFTYFGIYSQDETIPLWEHDIPNAISDSTYIEKPLFEGNEFTSTSQVSIPTLSIFKPKNPNVTAIVIFPGGSYTHLAILKEGFKVARWLNTLGITAYVVKYRLPNTRIMEDKSIAPLQDAQESMRYVRRHAKDSNINTVGVIGFSAGGHLASTLSTRYNDVIYASDKNSAKPDFSLLIYPVISMKDGITHQGSKTSLLGALPSEADIEKFSNALHINKNSPPTFLVHATDDNAVPAEIVSTTIWH